MDVIKRFNWERDWAIITGIVSLIAIGILISLGSDITTSEYVPRYDEPINYPALIEEFGEGESIPLFILVGLAGLLSISIFQTLRSGTSNTRTAGLMLVFATLIGASFLCVNTVTMLNFSGNSTTLRHIARLELEGKSYTVAEMDTQISEPYFMRNSVVLFECEDVTERVCRPVHTQFIGTNIEDDERPQVTLVEAGGVMTLRVGDEVVYQIGERVVAPLPDDLPVITAENAARLIPIQTFAGQSYSLDWASDGEMLAVGGVSSVSIYRFGDDVVTMQTTSNGAMQEVIFSEDHSRLGLFTRFDDAVDAGSFRILDVQNGTEIAQALFNYGDPAAMGSDLNVIASGLVENVTVRRIDRERLLAMFPISTQLPAYALAFSPDGQLLAIAGQEISDESDDEDAEQILPGFLVIMNAETGEITFSVEMLGIFDRTGVLGFSPDGRYVAYSRQNDLGDTTVVVWEVATQEEVQSFSILGRDGFVSSIAFNADGTLFATGSRDGTVRLWDMTNSDQLIEQTVAESPLNAMAFNPSGTVLAISTEAGEVMLYGVENEQ